VGGEAHEPGKLMVWRPAGKRVYYGRLPQRNNPAKPICLRTKDGPTARAMQRMLDRLAQQKRWAILQAIPKRATLAEVYEADQDGDVDLVLARLADADLAKHLGSWAAQLPVVMGEAGAKSYATRVRQFAGELPLPRSRFTPERIGRHIASLRMTNNGRLGHYKAIASFARYLVSIGAITENPMEQVTAPKPPPRKVKYLTTEQAKRVCDAAYEPYRSFFYLAYGTGIEVSVAIKLRRRDVDLEAREIDASGTKSGATRERIVRVAEWAWPQVEALCLGKHPEAPLFPAIRNRLTPSWQHRRVCKLLDLRGYTLHMARHSFAVRKVKAGTPVEIVARELGHADPTMVLRLYGRWAPSQHDRDKWEKIAAIQDQVATSRAIPGA
jgi:integrase